MSEHVKIVPAAGPDDGRGCPVPTGLRPDDIDAVRLAGRHFQECDGWGSASGCDDCDRADALLNPPAGALG